MPTFGMISQSSLANGMSLMLGITIHHHWGKWGLSAIQTITLLVSRWRAAKGKRSNLWIAVSTELMLADGLHCQMTAITRLKTA